jgi:protein involved in polysaccharide export with SLBB domain
LLQAGSTLRDAIAAAGGLTQEAYVFGTEFTRDTVRQAQIENYERALRDMEADFTRTTASLKEAGRPPNSGEAAKNLAQVKLIEKLRNVQPSGRVVLQVAPGDAILPAVPMDDGDRVYIPARPSTVSVYGSVFSAGSYSFDKGRPLSQYLSLAGGATRSADTASLFVMRANGSVVSNRGTRSGWVFGGGVVDGLLAEPGDTVFVPEDGLRLEFSQELKDWSTILYQFGLGAVALKSFR